MLVLENQDALSEIKLSFGFSLYLFFQKVLQNILGLHWKIIFCLRQEMVEERQKMDMQGFYVT